MCYKYHAGPWGSCDMRGLFMTPKTTENILAIVARATWALSRATQHNILCVPSNQNGIFVYTHTPPQAVVSRSYNQCKRPRSAQRPRKVHRKYRKTHRRTQQLLCNAFVVVHCFPLQAWDEESQSFYHVHSETGETSFKAPYKISVSLCCLH